MMEAERQEWVTDDDVATAVAWVADHMPNLQKYHGGSNPGGTMFLAAVFADGENVLSGIPEGAYGVESLSVRGPHLVSYFPNRDECAAWFEAAKARLSYSLPNN